MEEESFWGAALKMNKRVYIYCEGQTEESFVNLILEPYFSYSDIYITPIVCKTKRTNTTKYKGGVSKYSIIKNELTKLCVNDPSAIFTTMFDYYGMPSDTPFIHHKEQDIYKRIHEIEDAITSDINQNNCFFGLMLHEFEALLFSDPYKVSCITKKKNVVQQMLKIFNEFPTPEHINHSYETVPSRRLKQMMPEYTKVLSGTMLAEEIGIDKMLGECKHFAEWINKIRKKATMK